MPPEPAGQPELADWLCYTTLLIFNVISTKCRNRQKEYEDIFSGNRVANRHQRPATFH